MAASTAILAGLVLEKEVISRVLRREMMQESTFYQEILQEGRDEGKQIGKKEGKEEGRQETKEQVALNLLREGMTVELVTRVTDLPLARVQSLSQIIPPEGS